MLFDAIASLADAPTRLPPESVDSYLPQGIPIVAGVEASRAVLWFGLCCQHEKSPHPDPFC